MTSQQPDKFFRDKLYNYQPSVAGNAWNRVSDSVRKKSRWGVLLKVAASLLLFATSTLLLSPPLQNDPEPVSKNTAVPLNSQPPAVKPEADNKKAEHRRAPLPQLPDAAIASNESIAEVQPKKQRPRVQKSVRKGNQPLQESSAAQQPVRDPANTSKHVAMEPVQLEEDVVTYGKTTTAQTEHAVRKNITIVFTETEVNQKYLTKNTWGEATPRNEEPSGLKKLLDKAYDLKHNQHLLGNLRQKKNEILAMNFRTEKETTRND